MHRESPSIAPIRHDDVERHPSVFGERVVYQKTSTPRAELPEKEAGNVIAMRGGHSSITSMRRYDETHVWLTRPVVVVDMSPSISDIPDLTGLFGTTDNYLNRTASTIASLETTASYLLDDGIRATTEMSIKHSETLA